MLHAAVPSRIPTKFTDTGAMDGEKQLAGTRHRRERAQAASENLMAAKMAENKIGIDACASSMIFPRRDIDRRQVFSPRSGG